MPRQNLRVQMAPRPTQRFRAESKNSSAAAYQALQLRTRFFQKEGRCSYEAGQFHQRFDDYDLARGHAAADGQSR